MRKLLMIGLGLCAAGALWKVEEEEDGAMVALSPFLAALAIGDVSREAIRRWNPVVSRIEPEPENATVYQRQYGVFRSLYSRTRDLMTKLDSDDAIR